MDTVVAWYKESDAALRAGHWPTSVIVIAVVVALVGPPLLKRLMPLSYRGWFGD